VATTVRGLADGAAAGTESAPAMILIGTAMAPDTETAERNASYALRANASGLALNPLPCGERSSREAPG
jgi:hypothetical protein